MILLWIALGAAFASGFIVGWILRGEHEDRKARRWYGTR